MVENGLPRLTTTRSYMETGRGTIKLSIAPMVDITNRFYRFFMRQLSRQVTLYTEMINANAVLNNPAVLKYTDIEHPVAFQLGGCDAESLAQAAERCQVSGYDEVNLNCGCPSGRVSCGKFGACLMLEPETVRMLCAEMKRRLTIPVTVKCRLGVDDHDSYEELQHFIGTVSQSGVSHFIVHARKALLSGLTPEENRKIPPLQYEKVYRLVSDFPDLQFSINGGIKSHTQVTEAMTQGCYGAMLGRWAYENPAFFADVDSRYYGCTDPGFSRRQVMETYAAYCQSELDAGEKLSNSVLAKPLTNLFREQVGNSYYRVTLNGLMLDHGYDGHFATLVSDLLGLLETHRVGGLEASSL